jgi:hypothetical protein
VDIVLVSCALLMVTIVLAPRLVPARALLLPGMTAVLIVAVQLVNLPPVFQLEDDYNSLRVVHETGIWLGLGGSLAMLAGGFLRRPA